MGLQALIKICGEMGNIFVVLIWMVGMMEGAKGKEVQNTVFLKILLMIT